MTDDELTPYERGLLVGHDFARITRESQITYQVEGSVRIDMVLSAAQEPPVITREIYQMVMDDGGMAERLAESEDPDAESAFWGGFALGVRAYLEEVKTGMSN
jgi:hypothetical protein